MPGGDHTGPMGQGPQTGRGLGYCAGFDQPGWANPGLGRRGQGRGMGMGFGAGRGWRHRFFATGLTGWQRGWRRGEPLTDVTPTGDTAELDRAHELHLLQTQLQGLERRADQLRERLSQLQATTPATPEG